MRTWRMAALGFAAWLSMGAAASAAEFRAFTADTFEAAQAEGRPIVVEAHANWCPTCRAQAPVVRDVASDPEFDDLIVFTLDFDRQVGERRALGIRTQSTLIAFNGRRETMRSVGDTDAQSIAELLRSAVR